MKRIMISVLVLFLLSMGTALAQVADSAHTETQMSAEANLAYQTLKQTKFFATGNVGFAGTQAEGEKALETLLKEKKPTRLLQSLTEDSAATIEGRLFGLLGLSRTNPVLFETVRLLFVKSKDSAMTMKGCIAKSETVAQIVEGFRNGSYDSGGKFMIFPLPTIEIAQPSSPSGKWWERWLLQNPLREQPFRYL